MTWESRINGHVMPKVIKLPRLILLFQKPFIIETYTLNLSTFTMWCTNLSFLIKLKLPFSKLYWLLPSYLGLWDKYRNIPSSILLLNHFPLSLFFFPCLRLSVLSRLKFSSVLTHFPLSLFFPWLRLSFLSWLIFSSVLFSTMSLSIPLWRVCT